MKIEIITTKKKLTKAIVKQLEPATHGDIHHFNNMPKIGYYVRDLGPKFTDRVAVFEGINGWKTLPLLKWTPSRSYKCRIFSGNRFKDYDTQDEADNEADKLNTLYNKCIKNHLIL